MPKWGLSMTEGRIAAWLLDEGAEVRSGTEVVDIETEKIASGLEAGADGVLRRQTVRLNEKVPVGGLVAVIADPAVTDVDIDAFIADFRSKFVPAEAIEQASGPQPETAEVNGLRLRFLKRGEGADAALLLHGFGGDLNNWLFNHEALAQERAVYVLELPAHGASSTLPEFTDLRDFAEIVAAFLDFAGLKRVHLVGHSMGGAIATHFAVAHPDRVISLALIASAGLGPEIDGSYIEGFISAARRRDLRPVLEKLFADPSAVTNQLIDDVLKYKRLDGVTANLRAIADKIHSHGTQGEVLRELVAGMTAPVMVLFGSQDRIIPPEHADNFPSHITTHVLPGAGHLVQMEAAATVNRLVESFWKQATRIRGEQSVSSSPPNAGTSADAAS
jgi:pyruvate dehydrogenase E2 component (dihydrolipoamide acetyltransferase)